MLRRRQDKTRTVETIQRYGEDMDQSVLKFSNETGESEVIGVAEDVDRNAARLAVLEALKSSAGSLTREGIEDVIPIRQEIVRNALNSLVLDGSVIREGAGKRGNPFVFSTSIRMLQELQGGE